jgi:arabinogalactan endo-1,4-beta-galactosidase
MLQDSKINYDIIGYHWYSNMGDPTNARPPYGDVLKKVSNTYHKPIWITEFNYWQGSFKADFEKQNNYVVKTIKTLLSQNAISGLFIYELFDQPALRGRNAAESYYGLLYKDSTGNYVKKDLYNGYKDIITKYYSKN